MNIFMKTTFFVILCLSISACASISNAPTAAQKTYNSMDITLSNIGMDVKTCLDTVWSSHPELEKILYTDQPYIPQKVKNNKAYIRKADKKAMSTLISESTQCRKRGYEQIMNNPDFYVRSFAHISQESIDLRNDVYQKYLNGEITGGDAVNSLTNISDYLTAKWDAHNQQTVNILNQQHFQQLQTEAAMLQAMGSTFQNYNQQQQAYKNSYNQQQVNKPVHTQCRWDAGVMNCSSYQY